MKQVTQTAQFAALKRVLWFMEHRKKDYPDDTIFPDISFTILKRYVDDQEKQAADAFEKEKKIAELGKRIAYWTTPPNTEQEAKDFSDREAARIQLISLHASNVPAGHTGE